MELMTNEGKTKYLVFMRGNELHQNRNLEFENYCSEKVESFTYLEVNSRNNYLEETNLRIKAENRCYSALQKTFKLN
jgi:hypothetical protein